MLNTVAHLRSLAIAALLASAAVCGAQTTSTITAKQSASTGSDLAISLAVTGSPKSVAGFAFKVWYDSAQVSLAGAVDNTGQSASKMQYTLGPETSEAGVNGTTAFKILSGSSISDLKNASNLVELKFVKKSGFAAPLKLHVEDRMQQPVVDGLQDSSLQNIPHSFDVSEATR
jgi:hypothetical protein